MSSEGKSKKVSGKEFIEERGGGGGRGEWKEARE